MELRTKLRLVDHDKSTHICDLLSTAVPNVDDTVIFEEVINDKTSLYAGIVGHRLFVYGVEGYVQLELTRVHCIKTTEDAVEEDSSNEDACCDCSCESGCCK